MFDLLGLTYPDWPYPSTNAADARGSKVVSSKKRKRVGMSDKPLTVGKRGGRRRGPSGAGGCPLC